MTSPADAAALKAAAAAAAVELVEDGMLLGLGTGSTAAEFIRLLGLRRGRVSAIATSRASAQLAHAVGLTVLEEAPRRLDLAVDGADEIDGRLDLIKGRGGALVREKLVALQADRFVVIAESSKLVPRLGAGTLPVEVLPFMWKQTAARVLAAVPGAQLALRGGEGSPFVSDNGNLCLDLVVPGGIADTAALGRDLKAITGVVDHGLFVALATEALVAGPNGVRRLGRPSPDAG